MMKRQAARSASVGGLAAGGGGAGICRASVDCWMSSGMSSHTGPGRLLIASAWATRDGLRARAEWQARKVARRPALPRILFGAVLTGAALALGGIIAHGISVTPALYAIAGAVLHFGAFGADPMRDKGMEGIDAFQTDRVARVVSEAETTLAAMQDAILRANDHRAEARVAQFATQARALFRRVEEAGRQGEQAFS